MVDMTTYDKMKEFIGFGPQDAENLKALAPVFAKHGAELTEGFYRTLGNYAETRSIIDGRVESLKRTHTQWMAELFSGDYGEAYFERRMRIGLVHVRVGIEPHFVEGVMDVIRTGGLAAIFVEIDDKAQAVACSQSLLKLLDLDLMIINLAYGEERLERLTAFTGFSRRLIENCIKKAKK
jgi:hypothetical protein